MKKEEILKNEVNIYNALNARKEKLENELNGISQEMYKVLGKIELLQDLNNKKREN